MPDGTNADIDAATRAARAAFDDPSGWSSWSSEDRAQALERLAEALGSRGEEIARRVSLQNGMPISLSLQVEAVFPSVLAHYYAGLIRHTATQEDRAGLLGGTIHVLRKPVGVVGAIVPWNYPQTLAMFKLAPLLAAGCTVVMKPSPETVLDSLPARRGDHRGWAASRRGEHRARRSRGRGLPGGTSRRRQGCVHRVQRIRSHNRAALWRAASPRDTRARRQVRRDRPRRRRPRRGHRSAVRRDAA